MKNKILKYVNALMGIDFLVIFISIGLYFNGPESLQGDELLGNIHRTAGTIFFFLTIAHLILNFSWIKNNYLKRKGKK